MDKFDRLAADLRIVKQAIETAQASTEACRSEFIALARSVKKCEAHEQQIAELKSHIELFKVDSTALRKELDVAKRKLDEIRGMI